MVDASNINVEAKAHSSPVPVNMGNLSAQKTCAVNVSAQPAQIRVTAARAVTQNPSPRVEPSTTYTQTSGEIRLPSGTRTVISPRKLTNGANHSLQDRACLDLFGADESPEAAKDKDDYTERVIIVTSQQRDDTLVRDQRWLL
jgi:hypothetical protein